MFNTENFNNHQTMKMRHRFNVFFWGYDFRFWICNAYRLFCKIRGKMGFLRINRIQFFFCWKYTNSGIESINLTLLILFKIKKYFKKNWLDLLTRFFLVKYFCLQHQSRLLRNINATYFHGYFRIFWTSIVVERLLYE